MKLLLTEDQIRTRQAYPLDLKIQISLKRIEDWREHHGGLISVSYSGGKDSAVLLHLVRSLYPDTPAVFCDTGLEYPEIRHFAMDTPGVVVLRPKMNFHEVVEKHGWPIVSKRVVQYIYEAGTYQEGSKTWIRRMTGTSSSGKTTALGKIPNKWMYLVPLVRSGVLKVNYRCCHIMKRGPIQKYVKETGRFPYVGTTAAESKDRELSWKIFGCNAYDSKNPTSRPLMAWTEQDILQYIKREGLKIASVYGDIVEDDEGNLSLTGAKRTGCMFCMFGVHLEHSPNRFERMKKTHPKQWDHITRYMGGGKVLDILGVPWGDPDKPTLFDILGVED
jgi:3'-phosphoadenosine 5'-phosphosulfate sulfotransferase (PAPS reductase)/FAD synthetase